jgi:hypothetical protein
MNLRAEVIKVSPEQARGWLMKSKNFRRLDPTRAMKLARSIEEQGWVEDGNPFRFDAEGNLIDGQHRAYAIAKLGLTVNAFAVHGIVDDTTVDTGKSRTFTQYLAGMNESHVNLLAATTRLVKKYRDENMRDNKESSYTNRVLLDFLKKNPGIRESSRFASTRCKNIGIPASHIAMLHYVVSTERPELQIHVERFIDAVHNGQALDTNDPAYVVRERMIRDKTKRTRLPVLERNALLIIAWNKWITGTRVRNIFWRSVGPAAERFPRILVPEKNAEE